MNHPLGMPFDRSGRGVVLHDRYSPGQGHRDQRLIADVKSRLPGHAVRAFLCVVSLLALLGSACASGVATVQSEPAAQVIEDLQAVVPQETAGQAPAQEVLSPQEPPQPTPVSPTPVEEMLEGDAPMTVPEAEPAALTDYTVRAGDTLLGIAMQFDVPMAAVQLQNDLGDATTVRLGQVLEIPVARLWADASPFWVVHVVASGETLSEIAARYRLTIADLQTVNDTLNADFLAVGQALILPIRAPAELVTVADEPPEAPQPSPTPIPEPVAAAAEPELPVVEPTPAEEPTSAEEQPAPAVSTPPADVAALPGEIFRLLNEQRAAYGLPPLAWNATLASAAQRHADDCYIRGWCGHTGSDGSTYKERIIREGYDPVRWSECWAWYGSAERAVAMWMDEASPNDPHRRTILSDYLTEVGVGVVSGNGYGYYFIADFGTPR